MRSAAAASRRAGGWATAPCWRIASNLGAHACAVEPPRRAICSSQTRAGAGERLRDGRLAGPATVAFLDPRRMNEEAVLARARAGGHRRRLDRCHGPPAAGQDRNRCAAHRSMRWTASHAPDPALPPLRHRATSAGRSPCRRRSRPTRRPNWRWRTATSRPVTIRRGRQPARHPPAGLSPPALRRSRDHAGRGAAALPHPRGHRRRRAACGASRPRSTACAAPATAASAMPAPCAILPRRRPPWRRRRGAQPGAQPVPADPARYGPYSPSSRLFLNPLYADPARVFGAGASPPARWQRLGSARR